MHTSHIVLICDDNYCLPTIVCIQSIISQANVYRQVLTIHVCTFGLSAANCDLLKRMGCANVKVVIESFSLSALSVRLGHIAQKSHVTPTALIKFELPNFFYDIKTVLYLDSDIVVKGNLQELLDLDIGEHYLAATYEFWKHLNRIRYTLHRSVSSEFYFNSGVMLMNLKKMREDAITDKLWQYKLNKAKTTLMDQESLNAVCSHCVMPLAVKWNFNPVFFQGVYLKELNKVYGTAYQDVEDIEQEVRIVHYVGKSDKPWIYRDAKMREYWDIAYQDSRCPIPLKNKVMEVQRHSLIATIKDKVSSQGLWGTMCYIIYLIGEKNGEKA